MVDNVQGAQRELMKYWSRVSGNRWLVAKMFGVLMVGSRVFQLSVNGGITNCYDRYFSYYGSSLQAKVLFPGGCCISDGVWASIILWHQLARSHLYRLL